MNDFSMESILFKNIVPSNNISNIKTSKSIDDCVYDAYKSEEELKFYETYTMINDYNTKQKLRMLNKLRNTTNRIHNTNINNSCESYIRSIEETTDTDNNNTTQKVEKKKNIFIRILQGIGKVIVSIIRFILNIVGFIVTIVLSIALLPISIIVGLIWGDKILNKLKQKNGGKFDYGDEIKTDNTVNGRLRSLIYRIYKDDPGLIDGPALNLTGFTFKPNNKFSRELDKTVEDIRTYNKYFKDNMTTDEFKKTADPLVKTMFNAAGGSELEKLTSNFEVFYKEGIGVDPKCVLSPGLVKREIDKEPLKILTLIGIFYDGKQFVDTNSGRTGPKVFKNFIENSFKPQLEKFRTDMEKEINFAIANIKNIKKGLSDEMLESLKQKFSANGDVLKNANKYINIVLKHEKNVKAIFDTLKQEAEQTD